jgi:DNA-binding transcriptional LysR family regulator
MTIPWDAVRLFLAIAEGGSLTVASRALGVTQPTVSRQLAELEARLGEALFVRGVEGTVATPFGESLLGPARRMAESAGELTRLAERADVAPRGVVRITAPPGVAFELLAPFARRVREQLPGVQLEVLSTVSYVDLVRGEADLALRAQRPSQRDLVCLGSLDEPIAACASRAYRDALPRGYGLSDVGWLGWSASLAHLPPNPQLAARLPGFRPVFTSDDFLVQLRAAQAGVGAVVLSRSTSRLAPATELVELDLDLGKGVASLHLVCARSAMRSPRVQAVADLLAGELKPRARVRRRGGSGALGS